MRKFFLKNENRVIIILGLLMFLGFLSMAYCLIDRQVIRKDMYLASSFNDKHLTELIKKLIDARAFSSTENKVINIDEKMMRQVIGRQYKPAPFWIHWLEKKDRQRSIDRDIAFIRNNYAKVLMLNKKGSIELDPHALKIVFCGQIAGKDIIMPGSIKDIDDKILVFSELKNGKVHRNYDNATPALFSVLGIDHPVFGKHFLEKSAEPYLAGDIAGIRTSNGKASLSSIWRGCDVTITVSSVLQKRCFELLKKSGYEGAAIVIDAKSGAILAAVSAKTFDANGASSNQWKEVERRQPELLINKSLEKLYFPGSIYKIIVTAAWLEGHKNEETTVRCKGKVPDKYKIRCLGIHNYIGLNNSFIKSCNQYYSALAVELGKVVSEQAKKFGLDSKPLNLAHYLSGVQIEAVPSLGIPPGYDYKHNPKIIAQMGIGQNMTKMSVLQMAVIMSPFANKGKIIKPYLIKEVKSANGWIIYQSHPAISQQAVSPETARRIKLMLAKVMTEGTGKSVKKIRWDAQHNLYTTDPINGDILSVAGKTGSAQTGRKNKSGAEMTNSLFVGMAPASNPKYIAAVVLEGAGHGAISAAPMTMDILAATLNLRNNKRDPKRLAQNQQ